MSLAWSASQRYGLAPAPGGLGLVQDFLNTVAMYDYPDLLANTTLADDWAADVVDRARDRCTTTAVERGRPIAAAGVARHHREAGRREADGWSRDRLRLH